MGREEKVKGIGRGEKREAFGLPKNFSVAPYVRGFRRVQRVWQNRGYSTQAR